MVDPRLRDASSISEAMAVEQWKHASICKYCDARTTRIAGAGTGGGGPSHPIPIRRCRSVAFTHVRQAATRRKFKAAPCRRLRPTSPAAPTLRHVYACSSSPTLLKQLYPRRSHLNSRAEKLAAACLSSQARSLASSFLSYPPRGRRLPRVTGRSSVRVLAAD